MDVASNNAYPTPYANTTILPMLILSLAGQKNAPSTKTHFRHEYDYIIVGAGSAGSVLASRLSEVPCVSVLLLEAGKSAPTINDVPVIARNFWLTDIDWQFETVPQKFTGSALINNQVLWPSGKALGGSSILNAMLYVRGNKLDYDSWARNGAVGWSSSDVWPYFLKLEDNRDQGYINDGYHVRDGPISVEKSGYVSEIKQPILEAAEQMGYKSIDINGRNQTGFYDVQGTLRNGQRCSTAKAYLVPAENRTNLDIIKEAFVKKVIIHNRRAEGVIFDYKGDTYQVRAKKEVIMSAGTTNTAQLLMLSGIGPRGELEKFRIPVKADLPVGLNLQEHCGTPLDFEMNPKIPNILQKITDNSNIQEYIDFRKGPLSAPEGISWMAFLNNEKGNSSIDFPDYELYFGDIPIQIPQTTYGLKPEVFEHYYGPYKNSTFYQCCPQLLHPRSRGTVTLQSTNPYDPPLIDPNYLADERDIRDIVKGLIECQKIGTSVPLQKVESRRFKTKYPDCEQHPADGESYFECLARSIVVTFNHQVGTAKMGDPRDPTTVVDPQLRVKGVRGLRVVDASTMPTIPSGNTNIPTIMIAEKASDIIKNTINCPIQTPV